MKSNDEPFQIGEKVKLKNMENYPEYNGTEATISGNLTFRHRINPVTMKVDGDYLCYKAITFDGLNIGPRVDQIEPRQKPPMKVKDMEETI